MDDDNQITLVSASASRLPLRCPKRRVLLPPGIHRSGNSLLSYLMHTLGAVLPDEVVGPAYGNPLRHWEPRNFVTINTIDRSWDDPRPIDPAWFRSRDACCFIERILVHIRDKNIFAPFILLKDPRVYRILTLYLTAFDVLDIEPLVILQLRPFHEVGCSLADRDVFKKELSEFLWLRSIIEAKHVSRSCLRVWVMERVNDFDTATAVTGFWIKRTGRHLGLVWLVSRPPSENLRLQTRRSLEQGYRSCPALPRRGRHRQGA
jgi:hypothetical protein